VLHSLFFSAHAYYPCTCFAGLNNNLAEYLAEYEFCYFYHYFCLLKSGSHLKILGNPLSSLYYFLMVSKICRSNIKKSTNKDILVFKINLIITRFYTWRRKRCL